MTQAGTLLRPLLNRDDGTRQDLREVGQRGEDFLQHGG